MDLFGSSFTKHRTPRTGYELSYSPLGKHLNDMAVQQILKPSWVQRRWSCQEPANWCQYAPVQLQGGDGGVIALNLEEEMPKERNRSLPGLELNTVMKEHIPLLTPF